MSRCRVCFPATHNVTDYAVTFGNGDNKMLRVCRYCLEDLQPRFQS